VTSAYSPLGDQCNLFMKSSSHHSIFGTTIKPFGEIAVGLERPSQEMMGREGAKSGIDQVDVGESVDGEPCLAQQPGAVGTLLLGGQNRSRPRVCHGVRNGFETHRTSATLLLSD
jgi:hypothetical protein